MLKENLKIWLRGVSFLLLFILWGGELFRLKRSYLRKKNRLKSFIYYSCLSGYGSWIGIESKIEDVPVFPHGITVSLFQTELKSGKMQSYSNK